MNASAFILAVLSAAVSLPRVMGRHDEIYQAVAHVFVGGLFGAWLSARRRTFLWYGLALSSLEVACFLYYGKQV